MFKGTLDSESIVNIVSQFSGSKIARGDLLPETICSSCLQDAKNALGLLKEVPQFEEEVVDDVRESEEPHEEPFQCQVKNETLNEEDSQFNDEVVDEEEPPTNLFQVKNEPLEVDEFEEENRLSSNSDFEELVDEVKVEETEIDNEEEIDGDDVYYESRHGESNKKCYACQKTFILKSELKDHLQTHTGYRPFQCSPAPRLIQRI